MSGTAAIEVVKKFRLQQFANLETHIRRLGPLSKETTPRHNPKSQVVVLPNPFIPRKHPESGKWRPPVYSLRRQADLVKKAKASGTLHLLPPGIKTPATRVGVTEAVKAAQQASSALAAVVGKNTPEAATEADFWRTPVAWEGKLKKKKARGADLGITLYAGKKRMFKGHKWERVRQERLERRAILMRDMKKRIFNYKNYYKKRKPDPLRPPRTLKSPKLPF